jgi:hypothetical protein
MKFLYFTIVSCVIFKSLSLTGVSKYPVDVSFLIVDLKYSEKKKIKICEVQQGIISTFRGDLFANGPSGLISDQFYAKLKQFPQFRWTILSNIADPKLQLKLQESLAWKKVSNIEELILNPLFQFQGSLPPTDPYDAQSYHGIVFIRQDCIQDLDALRAQYPGIIFMDAATRDYWRDKYKMSCLFAQNSELAKYKPRWGLYQKKYHSNLANMIIQDLDCDRFVIKPRGAFSGKGVIIVDKEDLDETLRYILCKKESLNESRDSSYRYWYFDAYPNFLVEEFASSDPVEVPDLNGVYEPTIRVAFFLIYNNQKIDIEFCRSYLRLPSKSLNEFGTLNEKYKDAVKVPYYYKIDSVILDKIKEELLKALPLLYEQMLKPNSYY